MTRGQVRGYVLAGGESSRMQGPGLPQDKASLVWDGQTLLERASALLQATCGTYGILCGSEDRCARLCPGEEGVADRFVGMGPLGGLEAALADAHRRHTTWVLVVPVDLPFLTSQLLSAFLSHIQAIDMSVCCLRQASVTQPLPALVRVDALPFVQESLRNGGRKLLLELSRIADRLTPERRLVSVETSELRSVPYDDRWFQNINTPTDLLLLEQDQTSETVRHQRAHGI